MWHNIYVVLLLINTNVKILKELPVDILNLLEKNNAPVLLTRHLTLVYNTGIELTERLMLTWPSLLLNRTEILFGAATHDIGKSIVVNELHEKGNKHELIGYQLLIDNDINENLARFAKTHASWNDGKLKIEDLIVSVADKIWKGKRVNELEERLSKEISEILNADYWDVYMKLDVILSEIAIGADERLNWQRE